jgi:hypothetical protein
MPTASSFFLAPKFRDAQLDFQHASGGEADVSEALVQALLVGLILRGRQFQGKAFLPWRPDETRDAKEGDLRLG